jgi:hypothetical protein
VGLRCESSAGYRPTYIELTTYRYAEFGLLGSSIDLQLETKFLALNPESGVAISDLGIVGVSKSQARHYLHGEAFILPVGRFHKSA